MITPIKDMTMAMTNNFYTADTGIDIAVPSGTPVRAVAGGTIVYSEYGHTPWVHPPDTPYSILLKLDVPQDIGTFLCTLVWYTHLSKIRYDVPDGSKGMKVKQGEIIGWTGKGNNNAHLHFGILNNREQAEGDYLAPLECAKYMRKLIKLGRNK